VWIWWTIRQVSSGVVCLGLASRRERSWVYHLKFYIGFLLLLIICALVGWLVHCTKKTRYQFYSIQNWPHGWAGRASKTSPPTALDPRTVQSVANRYINWDKPTQVRIVTNKITPCTVIQNLTFRGRGLWHILIMKANEMHYFSYLFDKVLYMFRNGPLFIIRSISTLYTRNRYLSC